MLAGRKLLLADDSITIQKVVALTFADEGVEVVTVSDGREAIELLQGTTPDIVLADVFMPEVNGYEVCRYIKQNAKLKHIPVMLLVGSFEPFDEAEARRVGADDILTKPFQSIRRLIDKVGGLVGNKRATEATTAELPPVQKEPAEPEKLSTKDLEITTADTQPLPVAMQHPEFPAHEPVAEVQELDYAAFEPALEPEVQELDLDYAAFEPAVEPEVPKVLLEQSLRENQIMDSRSKELHSETGRPDADDVLLDLGDIDRVSTATAADDFVLDLDFDDSSAIAADEPAPASAWDTPARTDRQPGLSLSSNQPAARVDQRLVDTQEWKRDNARSTPAATPDALRSAGRSARPESSQHEPGTVRMDQLTPEMIDAIARRAVEQLSAQVIQEIAWEVVPQLAELLIKRKLEENQSLPK